MADPQAPGFGATVAEARDWIKQARVKGCTCPCCDQHAQIWKRHLNYAMAHGLILIYEYCAEHEGWLHVPTYLDGRGVVARGGDLVKLVHWGMLIAPGTIRKDKSPRVGNYRITEKGYQFVERSIRVPSYYLSYNNVPIGWSDKQILIDEALGKHFNYEELMIGVPRAKRPEPPPPDYTWPPPGFEG